MATELVALPSTVVSPGRDTTQLIVAFRVSACMSEVAIGIEETSDEVVVSAEAVWNAAGDASGGWFPYLTHASAVVDLERPIGDRRIRAVPDGRHSQGVC